VAVCEVLKSTSRTKEYIQEGERDGKSLTDAMEDGVLEGMQSFDHELERLIGTGVIDKEVALSYASNRTNLSLRLETQSGADSGPSIAAKPLAPAPVRRTGQHPKPDFDDLIER
jgi:Tfp pilus assembly ATPase PilU